MKKVFAYTEYETTGYVFNNNVANHVSIPQNTVVFCLKTSQEYYHFVECVLPNGQTALCSMLALNHLVQI